MQSLLGGHESFRWSGRWREYFWLLSIMISVAAQLVSTLDQSAPIGVKLVPNDLVELAAVRKPRDIAGSELRIERAEVAKLPSDRRRGAVQDCRKLLDSRIARFGPLKRNTTVQLKR